MTEEFDREIDTLLRQAAHEESVDAVSEARNLHLDADEINAFAENALPAKARLRTMEHLADCSRCRKILSDIIAFHSETKSETAPLIETKTAAAAPWYKRLFVFPQIAYATGALALIFTGIFGVAVLRNSGDRNSSQIAQVEEKSFDDARSSAVAPNSAENSNSASNTAVSANTSAGLGYSSNANMPSAPADTSRNKEISSSPSATPGADSPLDRAESGKTANPEPKPAATAEEESAKKEKVAAAPSPAAAPPSPARGNGYTVDGTSDSVAVSKPQTESSAQNSPVQNQTANQTAIMPDSRSAQSLRNLPLNGRSVQQMKNRAEVPAGAVKDDKDEERKAETRAVGGKNFRRADGVWYDVKYNGQKTTNVSRASSEYKKLDGGLRSIADNLGGVAIIVWKDKAYRIQ